MALFLRQRLPEVLGAPGDGVLVGTLMGHLGQPVQDGLGRVEVGEALGQVHSVILQRNPGHPPDHGIGEAGGALGQRLGHKGSTPYSHWYDCTSYRKTRKKASP